MIPDFPTNIVPTEKNELIVLIYFSAFAFNKFFSFTCPKAKFREKKFYLFKQILSYISLVQASFTCPVLQSKSVSTKTLKKKILLQKCVFIIF